MMLWSMPGIGGFATCASRGLPATVQFLRRDPRLLELLDRRGRSLGDYLGAMLGVPRPHETGGFLPEDDRAIVESCMETVGRAMLTMKDNFYEEPQRQTMARDALVDRLLGSPPLSASDCALGLPTKHVAPWTLRNWLPDWRIVQFLRDPRDVLVSLFYHDLAHFDRFIDVMVDTRHTDLRRDWKERYFGLRFEQMRDYLKPEPADQLRLVVRYEDSLADAAAELCRISRFLGIEPDERSAAKIAERYHFRTVTGGNTERRNSAIRSGKAGDWRRYFDRDLIEILGEPFRELVVRLGYEPDDGWMRQVPDRAEVEWDFSRFRRRASTVHAFMPIWYASDELQQRYPIPTDLRHDDNFFVWLQENPTPEVQRWLDLTARLSERWGVDIIENQYH